MSLLSLLIALAAERYLSSSAWQFSGYFSQYKKIFTQLKLAENSLVTQVLFVCIPAIICYLLLSLVSDGLLYFVISTLVLIVCFGCVNTRACYKKYLMAAFRGETKTCEMHYQQLLQDKNLPDMGFGQTLIWLNYRYFIAIMFFFVLFGAPGALFYRLVTKVNEDNAEANENSDTDIEQAYDENDNSSEESVNEALGSHNADEDDQEVSFDTELNGFYKQILCALDWLPVRIVAFGYMLVGHFSRAMPIWLENIFDVGKLPQNILISVAQKSEDFMVDVEDCTAEPCLLVRLAKRTLLLCLSLIAILILTGVIA